LFELEKEVQKKTRTHTTAMADIVEGKHVADAKEAKEGLVQVLMLLAADGGTQLGLVPGGSEEISLTFEDALLQFEDVASGAGVTAAQQAALKAVDAALERMSKGGETGSLWSDAALRTSAEWAAVRAVAIDAIRAFGRVPTAPDVSKITFVPK
jgi:hypothetical protein